MAIDLMPGQTVRVTVSKSITRDAARKTIGSVTFAEAVEIRP